MILLINNEIIEGITISLSENDKENYQKVIEIDNEIPSASLGHAVNELNWEDPKNPKPSDEILSLEQEQIRVEQENELKKEIEVLVNKMENQLLTVFEKGFTFNDFQIQGDKTAQQNANAFMVLASNGDAEYPLYWRTRDNSFMAMNNLDEVKAFSKAMLNFVQGEYQKIWTAKDSIRSAETIEDAEAIYNDYVNEV